MPTEYNAVAELLEAVTESLVAGTISISKVSALRNLITVLREDQELSLELGRRMAHVLREQASQ